LRRITAGSLLAAAKSFCQEGVVTKEGRSERALPPLAAGSAGLQSGAVKMPATISVRQLAELLGVSAIEAIKQLMRNGIIANINQVIDYDAAAAVAVALGHEVKRAPQTARRLTGGIKGSQVQGKEALGLKPRPPIVTIMGHVDHGKTRLLDAIRQTNVMATEAGNITQHIGAYQVEVGGQKITFLDTPGHEAFTAMRARGAQVTDIAVLVVAADDGVMPQTLEAIDHARAAGVPIVVAINKIDKPDANLESTKRQLADAGLLIEEWGGDTVCVSISAREKIGISELLENILLVAEMEELKANESLPGEGVVIEAGLDRTRGPLATVLIQNGSLEVGNTVTAGIHWGRVRAMFDDLGRRAEKAGPSTPVEILGLDGVPQAGDILTVVPDERQARALLIERQQATASSTGAVSLSNIYTQISAGQVKELNVVLKTDVQGSIEPIKASLERLGTEKVKVKVVHSGSGNITEGDVMLAIASKGLVISFGAGVETGARRMAEIEGVDIRSYNVIYSLVDDVDKALKGMLEPIYVEVIGGRGEVQAVFPTGRKGAVAGIRVTEGKASRGDPVRVRRGEEVVFESTVSSLRRFKDDVREVLAGYDAGVGVKDFNDFKAGDILEFFRMEEGGR
jgi:translation initiation factor IF-2